MIIVYFMQRTLYLTLIGRHKVYRALSSPRLYVLDDLCLNAVSQTKEKKSFLGLDANAEFFTHFFLALDVGPCSI